MKSPLLMTSILTALSLVSTAQAGHDDRRYEHSRYDSSPYNYSHSENTRYARAKVVHVEPISGYSESRYPRERCYTVSSDRDRRKGSIVGAVVGSVVGYKLGGDRGEKRLGSVAGAVVGSAIGQSVAGSGSNTRRRCEVTESRYGHAAIIGYNVTYKYKGQRYSTFMDYDPGRWIDVEVDVRPGRGYRH